MTIVNAPGITKTAADIRYGRRRREIQSGKVIIGGRNVCQRSNATSATGFTHHKTFKVFVSATDLVFRFTNYNASAVKEAAAASAVTIRASVRVNGQNHEISRNGARDLVITTGYIDSDPVAVEVSAGSTIIVSTYLVTNLPYSTGFSDPTTGTTYGDTFSSGDVTGPAGTVGTGTSSAQLYGPSLIVGTPQAGATVGPAIGIIGDSVSRGYNDSGSYGADGGGFIVRALETAGLPWVMVSRFSSGANDWTDVYGRKIRLGLIADCDYAVVHVGDVDLITNLRSALQAETDLIAMLSGMLTKRSVGCYVCTVTPNTSSTDGWATTANQTASPGSTNRAAYNDWIRAGAPIDNATSLTPVAVGSAGALLAGQLGHPIAGYFEAADTVESARNSGLWKAPGYTADGIHPGSTGHIAMAAAIDATKFI